MPATAQRAGASRLPRGGPLWRGPPVSINMKPGSQEVRTTSPLHHRSGDGPALLGRKVMAWGILVLAGLFEVGWAIGLKYTEGFTRLWPTVWTALAMIISLYLLGLAMKSLPVGTAYAIWVGVGAVGTVILGIVLLGEPTNAARMISVALIIAGIVGLKLSSP
jgi:quaternary ammonium compound-resistance protein SugE